MRRLAPVVLSAAGLLVAVDIVGALTGHPMGFPYPSLGAVSLLIYLSVGLLGALRTNTLSGILGAAAVGLLDGTLGPLAAWMVGSQRKFKRNWGFWSCGPDHHRVSCLRVWYRGGDRHGRECRCRGGVGRQLAGAAPGPSQQHRTGLAITFAKPTSHVSLIRPSIFLVYASGS